MSRRYPTAELYEERQREFYGNGNRSERGYDELDIDIRRGGGPRRSAPDFLREDYNRPTAGPMVLRKNEDEFSERGGSRGRREVEKDTLVIRGGRRGPPSPPSSVRETERDEFTMRRSETERPRRREFDTDETDITIRRREQSRGPSRPPPPPESVRETEREEISFRRGGGPRPREVDIEHDSEVRFQDRGPPRREEHRDEVIWRHDHREESRHGRERDVEKDTIVIRGRERSQPPPRSRGELVAREREEFVVRRREPSPPSPRRDIIKDEIIIRRREEARSPSPEPLPPPPPPPPEPEIRPPIIQEIITHHRHIDHGVERARSPTPPPPPPSPPRDETLEIAIRRKESHGGGLRRGFEEDIIFSERETTERRAPRPKKDKDMWTEITKDLVIREAIDSAGYDCEETDEFFYVMEYLRYEDVLRLVEISDDIRRRRKSRLREIEFERETIRAPPPPRSNYDERFYEREISYDRHRHRGGFR